MTRPSPSASLWVMMTTRSPASGPSGRMTTVKVLARLAAAPGARGRRGRVGEVREHLAAELARAVALVSRPRLHARAMARRATRAPGHDHLLLLRAAASAVVERHVLLAHAAPVAGARGEGGARARAAPPSGPADGDRLPASSAADIATTGRGRRCAAGARPRPRRPAARRRVREETPTPPRGDEASTRVLYKKHTPSDGHITFPRPSDPQTLSGARVRSAHSAHSLATWWVLAWLVGYTSTSQICTRPGLVTA